jgi:hypothetical protein
MRTIFPTYYCCAGVGFKRCRLPVEINKKGRAISDPALISGNDAIGVMGYT